MTRSAARLPVAFTALALLWSAVALAVHPTGDLAPKKRPGIKPDLVRVECVDCHWPHGTLDDTMVQPDDGTNACTGCHLPPDSRTGEHPIDEPIELSAFARLSEDAIVGPGRTIVCATCHVVHADASAMQTCGTCHTLQAGHRSAASAKPGASCLECHAVHDGVGNTARRTPRAGDPDGCLSCHAPGTRAAVAWVSPGKLGHPIAGKKTRDGADLVCTTCHDTHRPAADPVSSCGPCHESQRDAAALGGHGATTCAECHPVHRPAAWTEAPFAKSNPRSRSCLACHTTGRADTPQVAAYEHPAPVFDLAGNRWKPLAGLRLYGANGEFPPPAGTIGELTCATCHYTHGPRDGRDSLRRDGWEDACSSCHGDDALVLYRYFHQPERRASVRVREE